jgi:hypothetical protein
MFKGDSCGPVEARWMDTWYCYGGAGVGLRAPGSAAAEHRDEIIHMTLPRSRSSATSARDWPKHADSRRPPPRSRASLSALLPGAACGTALTHHRRLRTPCRLTWAGKR